MKSIYNYLLKNLYSMLVIFYVFFVISFFVIDFFQVKGDILMNLSAANDIKAGSIEDNVAHYDHYQNQVSRILNTGTSSSVDDSKKEMLNNLFESSATFSNFVLLNTQMNVLYSYVPLNGATFNTDLIDKTLSPVFSDYLIVGNPSLAVLNKDSNYVYIFIFKNSALYNLNTYSNYRFQIQLNGTVVYDSTGNASAVQIGNASGYNHPLLFQKFMSYEKVSILKNGDYIFTSSANGDLLFDTVFHDAIIPISFSILILLVILIAVHFRVRKLILKPVNEFIGEIEKLDEKEYSYLYNYDETRLFYQEFTKIMSVFKKISSYLEQDFENKQEELRRKLESAEESSRAKSLFLANMSHEMRTPLNSIIGYVQLITKLGFNDLQKVQIYFESINKSSEILLQKVNDILDLSKIESNKFELNEKPSDIRTVVKEVYDLLLLQAQKKNLQFSYHIDEQIPNILEIDETRLKQILINLCSNSIKFTDSGYVRLDIDLFLYKNDSVVIEYKITDSGMGIPKDMIDKIFYPFIQVDNKNRTNIGTGLGLTIARDLIRLMDGEINVTSKESVGSIFYFTTIFKITDRLTEEREKPVILDNETFSDKLKSKKIMLVEDNIINQVLMKEIFSIFNKNDIDIAGDGAVAVEMCRKTVYQIILMDIQMPNMDGVEASKIIRSFKPFKDLVIIALTANAYPEQIKLYLEAGMNDYLSKPVDINRLKHVINNYL